MLIEHFISISQDWQVKETAIPEEELSFLEMAFVLGWP